MAVEDIAEALVMPCVGGDTWLQSLVSFVLVARRVPQLYALGTLSRQILRVTSNIDHAPRRHVSTALSASCDSAFQRLTGYGIVPVAVFARAGNNSYFSCICYLLHAFC